jgi:hypothetical protein
VPAAAEVPKWCPKTLEASDGDLRDLKRSEPDYVIRAIAKIRCSNSAEVANMQTQVEQARQAWGKKLGMEDADWKDAVEYIDNRDGNYPKVELSTKSWAQFTPMDQWQAIRNGMSTSQGQVNAGGRYVIDALESRLTEVGREAWLELCFKERVEHSEMLNFAMCNGDVEAFDWAKFSQQLRSDTAHDGGTKMLLRFRALAMMDTIKEYKAARDKMFKADDAYKKLFDVAAKARADWAKGIGANAKLLDLLLDMDSATFAGSRKMMADCDAKTTAALQAAISTIPAKSFSGMADIRDDPSGGFAHQAGPVLVNNPQVNIAANAWAQCHPDTATTDWLNASLQEVPGVRGPRNAAIGAMLNEKIEYDDVNARPMQKPDPWQEVPYRRSGGSPSSAGGVVAKVTPGKEFLTVALQKTKIKTLDCVKSHRTNRVSRINSDGSLDYEAICDKTAMVEHDTTWSDFKINPAHNALLKKGVVFSAYYRDKFADIIAVWPSAKATAPSMVLGAKVK